MKCGPSFDSLMLHYNYLGRGEGDEQYDMSLLQSSPLGSLSWGLQLHPPAYVHPPRTSIGLKHGVLLPVLSEIPCATRSGGDFAQIWRTGRSPKRRVVSVGDAPQVHDTSTTEASSDASSDADAWLADLANAASSEQDCSAFLSKSSRASSFLSQALSPGRNVRPMRESDLADVVGLALSEFYEGGTDLENTANIKSQTLEVFGEAWQRASLNGRFDQTDMERLTDWFEVVWLRTVIGLGFALRVRIGQGGRDHRVFCVLDEERAGKPGGGALVAIAEISLQIPDGRTASRLPLPLWLKKLMAWPLPLAPYISNVLVNPLLRRQGLAKQLMLRCEDQARDWGCTQVYLHVERSNWPAVNMYDSIGYEAVSMLEVTYETPWLAYRKKIL